MRPPSPMGQVWSGQEESGGLLRHALGAKSAPDRSSPSSLSHRSSQASSNPPARARPPRRSPARSPHPRCRTRARSATRPIPPVCSARRRASASNPTTTVVDAVRRGGRVQCERLQPLREHRHRARHVLALGDPGAIVHPAVRLHRFEGADRTGGRPLGEHLPREQLRAGGRQVLADGHPALVGRPPRRRSHRTVRGRLRSRGSSSR